MKILPYRNYKIEIRQSKFEFIDHLSKVLNSDSSIKRSFFKVTETTFNGEVHEDSFKIYRFGFGNTSLIPSLNGKIIEFENEKKTYLELQISFHTIAYIFLSIWFGFVFFVFILSIISSILNQELNLGLFVALPMFLIPYGGLMIGFTEEVKIIKRYFYRKLYYKF